MKSSTAFHNASGDSVIADDPAMLQLLETSRMIARYPAAVLITGETGSGKEVIARLLRQCSSRSARPWVDVNCAALPEHLVESELFGYEKGAFSGADSSKPGLFELADGGTLFLDEIGEIDPRVQVKLLRVLDSVPYYRLGGRRKVSADVRVIAATNRDLEAAVHAGAFRRDLFHRISEFHIAVPPLRQRPRDVLALASHFLEQIRPGSRFTPDGLELLSQQDWPGNVRELRNLVSKLSVVVSHPEISASDIRLHTNTSQSPLHSETPLLPSDLTTVSEMERLLILRTLESTGGNQSQAAERLGIPRRTFCRKLNEYHITLGRRRTSSYNSSQLLPGKCRAELNVPVLLKSKDGRCANAEAIDLSIGGIGLRGVLPTFDVAEEVTVSFHLPGHPSPSEVQAVFAWIRPDGTAGVKFVRVSPTDLETLHRWMEGSFQSDPLPPEVILRESEPAFLAGLCR
ncbi:MAG TPA: sigma 54-interacting transcriptional regulator [Candidatus Eisenbacteria bacterium]|nr:sigma 54-interacting transcriptional regulator [Candidatus Eisenbacteria bacterium]